MARHLQITGIVQGVGYRAAFARKADALEVSGWVRNRLDGSVEAVISGTDAALDQMIAWAQAGPTGARVSKISVSDADDAEVASHGFEIFSSK